MQKVILKISHWAVKTNKKGSKTEARLSLCHLYPLVKHKKCRVSTAHLSINSIWVFQTKFSNDIDKRASQREKQRERVRKKWWGMFRFPLKV